MPGYPPDQFYPATNQFPPPPNIAPVYNPADYGPPPQVHPDYGYSPQQQGYQPPAPEMYSPMPPDPYAGQNNGRRANENVSAEPYLNTTSAVPPTYNNYPNEEGG